MKSAQNITAAGGPNFATLQNADEVTRWAGRQLSCVLYTVAINCVRLQPYAFALQSYYAVLIGSCLTTWRIFNAGKGYQHTLLNNPEERRTRCCQLLRLQNVCARWMSMEHRWNNNDRVKSEFSEITCRSAFFHHKSHQDWPGIENGFPKWEVGA